MKTRYKISITVGITMVALFALVIFKPIICDDIILPLDDCGHSLNEKYSKLPIVKHFMEKYPDSEGLGFHSYYLQ